MVCECFFINALVQMNTEEESGWGDKVVSCWCFNDSMSQIAEEGLIGGTEHGILDISFDLFTCDFL